jgi:two-component system sensor histidine kinase KdpD
MADYRGIQVREFDLDGGLTRHPQVLLVDELAHTNVSGSRHQKRYQDIEELLNHGISVYTTVNIQHLESLNDIVENITSIRVSERIPDRVFDHADQVKLVDIEPEELICRMQEGKIYQKAQAQKALQNFFTRDKLTALREIALRRMADRVNHLAEEEKREMGSHDYPTGEHILTCISPSPTNAKVIRCAARLAYAFHASFTALFVETRSLQNADVRVKKRRDENMRLARALGAEIVTIHGENVAWQIGEYAKVSNVTKIVLGRTNHKILAAVIAAAYFLKNQQVTEANIIMLYLLGVMVTSVFTEGYICSLVSSVLGEAGLVFSRIWQLQGAKENEDRSVKQ